MATVASHFEKGKPPRCIVKHGILKSYSDAWIPKMLQRWYSSRVPPPVVFVDGFAGTGRFNSGDGESANDDSDPDDYERTQRDFGSPLVLLKSLYEHTTLTKSLGKVVLICIEAKGKNYEILKKELQKMEANKPTHLQTQVEVITYEGFFNEVMIEKILPNYSQYPMFVFADPFGYGTIKMKTFHAILSTHTLEAPKELFINFMDSYIRRFERNPLAQQAQDELFGFPEWRDALDDVTDADEKLDILCDVYIQELHNGYPASISHKEPYSLRFGIRGKLHDHVYHLVFVTSHISGMESMKYAMNRYSQSSAYRVFSEWVNKKEVVRNVYFEKETNVNDVKHEILNKVKGTTVSGAEIRKMITLDSTFHCNFVINLKSFFKQFAKNPTERRFDRIIYDIPPNVEEILENLNPPTPRRGEKHATIEEMGNAIEANFRDMVDVSGGTVLTFVEKKYPEFMKTKRRALIEVLTVRGYMKISHRMFKRCVFDFSQNTSSSPSTPVKRRLF